MNYCTELGNMELHQQLLRTEVTCLGIIDNHVISGMGGFIRIFNILSSKLVAQIRVFDNCKLHGISKGSVNYFVVFGGRKIAIIYYDHEISHFSSLKIDTLWHIDDWILCAQWLEDQNIAIGTAQNTVILWNWKAQEKVMSVTCEEKCILYSCTFVGYSWDQLVVLAGTVFQEVIIWSPSDIDASDSDCCVLHRLQGHKGVIFSSHFNPATGRIHTTSDDRSVKGWQVSPPCPKKWQLAEINLVYTMYGHTARVWKSVGLEKCTISIGEDSQMCVWNMKGELLKRWSLHQGGSIWSIACSEEKRLLVTGGSDGSISSLSLDHCLKDMNSVFPIPVSSNLIEQTTQETSPRRVILLKNGDMIVVLQSGHVMHCSGLQNNIALNSNKSSLENVALCLGEDHCYSSDSFTWTVLYFSPKFANYCLLEMSSCKQRFALASLDGQILIFGESSSSKTEKAIEKIVDFSAALGKIFSLQWLSPSSILTCEVMGKLCLWSLQSLEDGSYSFKKIKTFILPYSKERWVTSAMLIDDYLICGDRVGSIHLYLLQGEINDNEEPKQTLSKVHGRFGVSFLMVHHNHIFSCGRDGTLRQYQNLNMLKSLKQLCVTRMPFDWISSCCVIENDILVLGFCEKNFVVWTQKQQRLLCEVPCGGGHRSWDYIVKGNCLNFVYIKQKCLFVASCDLKISSVLQTGFHPKEVNCLQVLHRNLKFPVLISGGEDTTIRVALACTPNNLHTLIVLHSHLSSIRAIACCEDHENKLLMFSAGGRAQIKAWELTFGPECGRSEVHPKILCQELSSHMLMNCDNKQHKSWKYLLPTVDPETRYMSLCPILYNGNIYVAAGCSDGYFRVLLYCRDQQNFQLVGSFEFHQRCILNVACVSALNVITMATDGIAAFWDLSVLAEHSPSNCKLEYENERNSEVFDLKPLSEFKLHQSGIDSFDLFALEKDHFLLATGGDDTALVISAFRMSHKPKCISQVLQWRMESAHIAQITGLAFVDQHLISTSVDQKVFVWKWFCNVNKRLLFVTKVAAYCTTIADIHGLKVWPSGNSFSVCVYGKGVEIIHQNQAHEDVK